MAQFTVYRNSADSSEQVPFLLDVQNDLLAELRTRVVIPLQRQGSPPLRSISRLTPEVTVQGERCLLMTPQMAGVSVAMLGNRVGSLVEQRAEILAAIDLLVVGF